MPLIRSPYHPVASADREKLIELLAAELKNPDPSHHQPVIFEQGFGEVDRYVTVFWDEWAAIPREHRSSIIFEAYQRVLPAEVENIMTAAGFTFEEAIESNLLPYEIQTTIKKEDAVDPEELRKALIEAGAIQTLHGLHLKFPDSRSAQESYEKLTARFPAKYFQIIHTLARNEN